MGDLVGGHDGRVEGDVEGENVGRRVGGTEGACVEDVRVVGGCEGRIVGFRDGVLVGDVVGLEVKRFVGLNVGERVGLVVGERVGEAAGRRGVKVGDVEGRFEGEEVGGPGSAMVYKYALPASLFEYFAPTTTLVPDIAMSLPQPAASGGTAMVPLLLS